MLLEAPLKVVLITAAKVGTGKDCRNTHLHDLTAYRRFARRRASCRCEQCLLLAFRLPD